jgi:hypothetical protein
MKPPKKSPIVEKPRQRRPKGSGVYPIFPLRLPPDLAERIDKAATKAGTTKSGLIREWIEAGLKRRPKG